MKTVSLSLCVVCFLTCSLNALPGWSQGVEEDGAPTTAARPEAPPSAAESNHGERLRDSQPTFGLDHIPQLQREMGGFPLWQYCASLIWVVLAFLVAAILDFLMTHKLRKLAAQTKTELDEKLLEVLRTPVKATVFLLMLNIGVRMFQWPDWAEKILSGLFTLSVAVILTFLAVRLVDLLASIIQSRFFSDDAQFARLLLPVLGKSLKVFVTIIGTLTTAQFMGLPITSVVAGLGIGGIAVALAAQGTLANVFGTVTLLADRPFRVGDRVQIDNHDGVVETIGLRSTRIRTLDGHVTTIPNKTVAESAINNVTLRPNIRQLMTISLTYGTTHERMQEAVRLLREIFQRHPLTHDAWVYWRDYSASSLDIFVVYWCRTTDYKLFLQTLEALNLEIKQRFDAAGLEFAFPTQTIHLCQESRELPAKAA